MPNSDSPLSLREVCDGFQRSQRPGVPGRAAEEDIISNISPSGSNTWFTDDKLYLKTTNLQISKLFLRISKGIRSQNVICCTDLTIVRNVLRRDFYDRAVLIKESGITKGKPVDQCTSKFLFSIRDFRLKLDARLLTFQGKGFTFLLTTDLFLMDVIAFCAAETAVLYDLYPNFNFKFNSEQQIKLLLNALSTIHPDDWISSIKYHTAYPMARYFSLKGYTDPLDPQTDIMPTRPKSFVGNPWIWTGQVLRFLKNKINCNTESARTLGFSFLQGIKRGCAAVPESFLIKELESHVLAMTTPPVHIPHRRKISNFTGETWSETDDSYLEDMPGHPSPFYFEEVDVITDTFLVATKSFFKSYCKPYIPKIYEPSHNSCFEQARSKGGAYSTIVRQLDLPWIESEPIVVRGGYKTNHSYQLPDINKVLEVCRSKIDGKKLLLSLGPWLGDISERQRPLTYLDTQELPYLNVYKTSINDGISMYIDTAVIPLSEPLKVRTITKSEALSAYASKSLQKAMKNYIDRYPSLILTTRPLQPHDFRDVWTREKNLESKIRQWRKKFNAFSFDFYLHTSGDYKAATDKLNINFTKLIFEEFLSKLGIPESDLDIYRQVLYAQRLHYPGHYAEHLQSKFPHLNVIDDPIKTEFCVEQKNGQLMGSILSFPILCLANLICYKLALEEYININNNGEKFRVNPFDLPVLVNGDDIYFRTNPEMYKIWLKYINIAGFQLSVGKNYVHPNTFTINSQCFHYNNVSDTLSEQTYLNTGLLIAQSKSGAMEDVVPVWDLYNKVLKGAHDKHHAHNRFLYHHKQTLNSVSKKGFYNFFLPPVLGGLGMIRQSSEIPVLITSRQRQLATFLHNQIVPILGVPKIGKPLMSTIKMIDKLSVKLATPYQGEPIYMATHAVGPLPENFVEISSIKEPDHMFIHHIEPVLNPRTGITEFNPHELVFRGLDTVTFKAFYKSNRYRGNLDFFNFDDSVSGCYPYKIIQSLISDPITMEENLTKLVVNSVLDDIIGEIESIETQPLKQEDQP